MPYRSCRTNPQYSPQYLALYRRKHLHELREEDVKLLGTLEWNSENWKEEDLQEEHPPLELRYFGAQEYAAAVKEIPIDENNCVSYPIGKILGEDAALKPVRPTIPIILSNFITDSNSQNAKRPRSSARTTLELIASYLVRCTRSVFGSRR